MGVLFANNAATTLASGIATGTTSVTVASGEGAKFPSPTGSDWFPVVLQRKANYSEVEIARCTGRSGDTLTLQRAREGTTALTFVAGDILDLRLTAEAIAAIDADFLDGEQGSFYRNASNLNAGILPAARFNNTSHGSRGGGSLHSAATTSANGFMSSTDKSKLDGVEAGAQVNVGTDLALTGSGDSRTVTSSTGNNVAIPVATGTNAGFMATGDKSKLDSVQAGAQVNVATNLSRTIATTSVTVNSSTGDNATIPAATVSAAGVMAAADKSKLDGIQAGAEVNVGTNLAATRSPTNVTITSSTGNNAVIALADTSNAGVMSPGDKTKLDGIAAGAQVNVGTDLSRSVTTTTITVTSSTGNNTTLPAATTGAAGVMTAADKSKLNGIAAGAEVNVGTNLSSSRDTLTYTITSSTGSNTSLAAATASLAGVMRATDKSKLDGIETGAQVNVATNLGQSRASTTYTVTSSTGTNTVLAGATTSLSGVMIASDKTKLDAVGTIANRNLTISTSTPSGGNNGDVWFQYE